MKRTIAFVSFLIAIQVTPLFAHKQHVHQYIVREAAALLLATIGEVPELSAHVGVAQTGDLPFSTGLMVTGAWREDVEDPVYDYQDVFFHDYGLTSITHFWKADNGDNASNSFDYCYPTLSSCETGQIQDKPNAWTKVLRYAYPGTGGHWTAKVPWPTGPATFTRVGGGTVTIDQTGSIGFAYDNLFDFYKNRVITITGYYYAGQWINSNLNHNLPYQVIVGPITRDLIFWEVVGRMAHLLGDQSVPTHTRQDEHGIDHDPYEDWVGGVGDPYTVWSHSNVGTLMDPYLGSEPLHYLFYTLNQRANHFASYGPYDGDGNNIVGGNPRAEETSYLNSIPLSSLGGVTGMPGPTTEIEKSFVRDATLPQAIRTTAGLFYWVAIEAGLLDRVTVKNNFSGGNVIVNQTSYPSGMSIAALPGTELNLNNSTPQTFDGYQRHFRQWEKLTPSGVLQSTHSAMQWTTSNDGSFTYQSIFDRQFDIGLSTAFLESGSGGSFIVNGVSHPANWTEPFIENQSTQLTIQAVPPTGYVFTYWSDGTLTNPYIFTPIGHKSLAANFKWHLASTIPTALASNNQRKFMKDIQGSFHLVYESGGEIWYTKSTDGGAIWTPELRLSGGGGGNSSPSLYSTSEEYSDYVRVVWVNSNHVNYRHYEYNYNTLMGAWTNEEMVLPINNSIVGTPTVGPYGWVVYYRHNNIGSGGSITAAQRDGFGNWYYTPLPGSDNQSKLSSILVSNPLDCNIIYEQPTTGAIMYNKVHFDGTSAFTWATPTPTDISAGSSRTSNGSPSLAWDPTNSNLYAAWHGWNASSNQNEIVVRRNTGSWESSFTYFGSGLPPSPTPPSFYNPVIRELGNYSMEIAWWSNDNTIRAARYNGFSWRSYNLGIATTQNVSPSNNTDGVTGKIIYSTGSSAPYQFQFYNDWPPSSAPSLVSPANASANQPLNVTLSWTAVSPVTSYQLQLGLDANFTTGVVNQTGLTALFKAPGGLNYYWTYYWRVRAFNVYSPSDWSSTRYFGTVQGPPPPPPCDCCAKNTSGVKGGISTDQTDPCDDPYRAGGPKENPATAAEKPTAFGLSQNFPNGFNPSTQIKYSLPVDAHVRLAVYDVLGREVATLVDKSEPAGFKEITFNAGNLPSGMYFYRITAGDYSDIKKMILLK